MHNGLHMNRAMHICSWRDFKCLQFVRRLILHCCTRLSEMVYTHIHSLKFAYEQLWIAFWAFRSHSNCLSMQSGMCVGMWWVDAFEAKNIIAWKTLFLWQLHLGLRHSTNCEKWWCGEHPKMATKKTNKKVKCFAERVFLRLSCVAQSFR